MGHEDVLAEYAEHLGRGGRKPGTVRAELAVVRQFLRHVGDRPVEHVNREDTAAFINGYKNKQTRRSYSVMVSEFLKWAAARLPAVVPAPAVDDEKDLAPLHDEWQLNRLISAKKKAETTTVQQARTLLGCFAYFEKRLRGEEDLDELRRLHGETKALITARLDLLAQLSTEGHSIHPALEGWVNR